MNFDAIVIGGGIVGLATAWKLRQRGLNVCVLEKEPGVGTHQSGRNSGVLHSGIYYKPGSLKARTCLSGRAQMERFCDEHGIPWKRSGKIIVATAEEELPRLDELLERGRGNGVHCERVDGDELRRLEPHCAGIAAIVVREAGVVDFREVCRRLASMLDVTTGAEVTRIEQTASSVRVTTRAGAFEAASLINCAGLHSDRIARLAGDEPPVRILPFRGEYFDLTGDAASLCRTMIYPVPDPRFPFLGVHFTRSVEDHVHCGPNAVVAFAREGYRWIDVNLRDVVEMAVFGGSRAILRRHWRMAAGEMVRSLSKRAFVQAAQRLIPAVREADFVRAPAGVRAQAVTPEGTLVDDFVITRVGRVVNVLNTPSPAATASLAIGDEIAATVLA